jgi:hypothetical protein
MFSDKPINTDKDMEALIKREARKSKWPKVLDQPKVAIQRMRYVVGAYLYMKDEKVDKIFVAQVDRIGAQLENIENALAETPITIKKQDEMPNEQGILEVKEVILNKWERLNLKKEWFTYMDGVYIRANNKAQDYMTENFRRLDAEYKDKKIIDEKEIDKEKDKDKQKIMREERALRVNMKEYIKKLKEEWEKTKNWPKPNWNSQAPGNP